MASFNPLKLLNGGVKKTVTKDFSLLNHEFKHIQALTFKQLLNAS